MVEVDSNYERSNKHNLSCWDISLVGMNALLNAVFIKNQQLLSRVLKYTHNFNKISHRSNKESKEIHG